MSKRFLDRRWPWIAAAAAIVAAFLSTFVDVDLNLFGKSDSQRPLGDADDIAALAERDDLNVLFILVDTLRADRLGAYGYERDTSPRLDALADEGARFARHLAQSSWTKVSMASLWTGLNPTRTGVLRYDDALPEEAPMAAELLKEAGFRTVGLYRNGWVAPTFGFEQGFDVYTKPATLPLPEGVRVKNPTVSQRGTDQDVVASALEFLRASGRDERWFLYLHLMDVHEYVYDEQTALFGGGYSDIYDNAIRWTDSVLGVLFDHLEAWGYDEDTLVVITSDHGEAFRERGFEGHARKVYRESTEVPFLLSFPFRLEPGLVVEGRSRLIDVWPTILDLIGIEPPAKIDGRSRVPALLAAARGEPSPDGELTGIAHLDQSWGRRQAPPLPTVAVTEGPFRYVRVERSGGTLEQLFDASRDPRELENRAAEEPETVERLSAVADAYLEETPPWGSSPTKELDEMELDQLRALGYAIP